jgi:hypothetical protein
MFGMAAIASSGFRSARNARAASIGSGGIAVGIVLDYLFTHR